MHIIPNTKSTVPITSVKYGSIGSMYPSTTKIIPNISNPTLPIFITAYYLVEFIRIISYLPPPIKFKAIMAKTPTIKTKARISIISYIPPGVSTIPIAIPNNKPAMKPNMIATDNILFISYFSLLPF